MDEKTWSKEGDGGQYEKDALEALAPGRRARDEATSLIIYRNVDVQHEYAKT